MQKMGVGQNYYDWALFSDCQELAIALLNKHPTDDQIGSVDWEKLKMMLEEANMLLD